MGLFYPTPTYRFMKDFRESFLSKIVCEIENEEFVRKHSTENSFVRNRKLNFIHLLVLITQGLTRSIQRELNTFFQKLKGADFSIQEVTKGAFSHARKKLKPEAFIDLNKKAVQAFYEDAPYLKWNNFRLLAIDGSSLHLPRHPTVEAEYGVMQMGQFANAPRSIGRLSMLYDVLNFITVDARLTAFDRHERDLAMMHFDCVQSGTDLVIMDRGYPSRPMMYELMHQKKHFLFRMHDDWWTEIKKIVKSGEKDTVATFTLSKDFRHLADKYSAPPEIKCRVVVVTLPTGGIEVLCTSVMDKDLIPYEAFVGLYHLRWNIEEGYKLYKSRLQLDNFSGKTALAVKQDLYSKVFMMTVMAVMAFPIEEKLKREQEDSKRKNRYKPNRTNALSFIKENLPFIFIKKALSQAIKAFDKILTATVEVVRPNRKNPRKKIPKKPPNMNYKQL